MSRRLRHALFAVLALFLYDRMNIRAQPSNPGAAHVKVATSLDAALEPSSLLLVGGGLLVFGEILRRRLRT